MTETTHVVPLTDTELGLIRYTLESWLLRQGQTVASSPATTLAMRDLLAKIVGRQTGTDRRTSDPESDRMTDHHRRRLSDLFKLNRRDLPPIGETLPAPFDFMRTSDPVTDAQYPPGTRVRITVGEYAGQMATIVRYKRNQVYILSGFGRDNLAYAVGEFQAIGGPQ